MRTRAIPERFCGGDSLRRGAISSVLSFLSFDLCRRRLLPVSGDMSPTQKKRRRQCRPDFVADEKILSADMSVRFCRRRTKSASVKSVLVCVFQSWADGTARRQDATSATSCRPSPQSSTSTRCTVSTVQLRCMLAVLHTTGCIRVTQITLQIICSKRRTGASSLVCLQARAGQGVFIGGTTEGSKAISGGRVLEEGAATPPHQRCDSPSGSGPSPDCRNVFHYFQHSGWPLLTL